MATFLMLGNCTAKAMEGINCARSKNASRIFKKANSGGRVCASFLDQFDPARSTVPANVESTMEASPDRAEATGISSATLRLENV